MDGWRRTERWALIFLFLLAFVPRAIYPVSRPLQWYFRSAEFLHAVLRADWAGTLFSEHPGVTVMWLSGAALWGWYALQSLLGLNPPTPLQTEGYAFADRVAVGVLPLALLVALGIVWGWHLLRRLFGRRVAWLGALLWALDPFYLANSKVLHLDATLSTLMLLSALWMLITLRQRRLRTLIISAILGGLAILTKVTALFLIPFWGLCLLSDVLRDTQYAIRDIRHAMRDWLLWLLAAGLICFLLWPSLWVQPTESLNKLFYHGLVQHVDEAHGLPRFHQGVLRVGDPGAGFYSDVVLFRSTFLTLPFSLLGLLAVWAKKRDTSRSILLIAAFIVFFFIQMTLGGRKDSRYMLPALLAMDVLSALGIVWWTNRLQAKVRLPAQYTIPLMLLLQAILVLARFPYYGTCYNELLGGSQAAKHVFALAEFGEGLDLAGQYVDQRSGPGPSAEAIRIGTQFLANEMVAQHVRAPVRDIAQTEDNVDYLIFGVRYTTRGEEHLRWGKLWERIYKFREPTFVVAFDGISYAWVHRPNALPIIPQQVNARLGYTIQLEGYRLVEDKVAPGDPLLFTLYWRSDQPITENYTVFTHLRGPEGRLIAQRDNPPARGTRPTSSWESGKLVEDPYEIEVPIGAPHGKYTLNVGMYDSSTMERLPAYDASNEAFPNNQIVLQEVSVRPVVPVWRYVLSGTWLTIILSGTICAPEKKCNE